jgi:hypothetical protein
MNRKNLTAAVLAGLAGAAGIVGSAQAVNINPDGLGQVLIYPYYTTNGGNNTLLSVVNTSEDAKAVKVRFMEGQNSQEVLDFNLYMSAFDVWAAAITKIGGADATPFLIVDDTSCTVPYLYLNQNAAGERNGWQKFLPYEMIKDGGSSASIRMAEGHFEMIEMGTLVGSSAAAATHGATGHPASCASLVAAWTQLDSLDDDTKGYWLQNPFQDLEAPSGGLFGGGAIVNVQGGAMMSYDATAINGFADSVLASDILHQVPGSTLPSLNSGNGYVGTVFMDNGSVLSSDTFTRGVDAISFLFMHDQLMNEYTTELYVAAHTEWVLTFPTKAFYVYEESSGSSEPIAPFTSTWDGNGACEIVVLDTIWDREEQRPGDTPGVDIPPIVSPAPPNIDPDGVIPFALCYETSVIRFGDDEIGPIYDRTKTELLGSRNFHSINNEILGFEYGWARLQMAEYPFTAEDGTIIPGSGIRVLDSLTGLPVMGFGVQRAANGFLIDLNDDIVLANYAGIFGHKGTRMLSGDTDGGTPNP